jgi:DNA-binding response OmpR family regulator
MARILVAEDERDIRELINFTLTFAGHTLTLAPTVKLAQEIIPDLIMMDVRMPKMTGYEACREMKKIDSISSIPVVFLSAKGQDDDVQTGLDAGAIRYILKPFSPEELTQQVNEILQHIGVQ